MADHTIASIMAALQAGDLVSAEQMCRISLELRPDDANILFLQALALQQQGKVAEAVPYHAKLTRLKPEDVLYWGNYAAALQASGDIEAALDAARMAVSLAPEDPDRLEQLGLLQLQRNEPIDARDILLKAFGLAPRSASIRIHAARACAACRDARAVELLRPWRTWLPLDDSLQFELADLLVQSGEAMDALELLEVLTQGAPLNFPAQLLLANIYERVNRLGDAEVKLRQLSSGIANTSLDVHREIQRQQAQLAFRKGALSEAHAQLEMAGPRDDMDSAHYFVLARICDQTGGFAEAMSALQEAHLRQIAELRIATPHRFAPGTLVLPRAKSRVSAMDYHAWPHLLAPDAEQSPVFIVGFPRSGTTLLEQMLDAHPRLQSMDERPFFSMLATEFENVTGLGIPGDLARLSQRDCDELRKGYLALACSKIPRRWDACLVDKNPLNMLRLPMILRLFPQARFILALRHPCDVILSCYMQNFRSAVLAAACASLERLAQAYVAAMECWLYHVDLIKPNVFVSRYEELVADTPAQTRRIAKFLGLDDAESMLHFDLRAREKGYIATPSYTQVIEPMNRKGMNRWHRYHEYFKPVLPVLEPMLKHWRYETI